jgi:hypothetical protein
MAKALGGDAPEMYQRKGSSNLLTRLCKMNVIFRVATRV